MLSLGVLFIFSIWLMPRAVRVMARQWDSDNASAKTNALVLLFGNSYLLAYTIAEILQKLFS